MADFAYNSDKNLLEALDIELRLKAMALDNQYSCS